MLTKKINDILKVACLVILFFGAYQTSVQAKTTPLSDLSLDLLDGADAPAKEQRDPFKPGASTNNIDPSSLSLEGIIIGPQTRLCLISEKILKEGHLIGAFVVKEIHANHVIVQSENGTSDITMGNYIQERVQTGEKFEIAFSNANLRKALRMLATAGNFNMILPESIAGRVSLIFHQTSLTDALGAILRVNGLDFAEEDGIYRVGKPDEFAVGAFFDTRYIPLKYATAADIIPTVKNHLSEKGSVTADTRTNTLIVKDTRMVLDHLLGLVTQLDQKDTQVRIEAKIVDVSRNFSRSVGIQWGFTKTEGRFQGFGANDTGNVAGSTDPTNVNLPAGNPTSGFGILVGNLINGTDLQAQLTAAESNGDAHIISQPSITTVNNTPARIRSGVKIYVKSTSNITVGGDGGSATGEESGVEEIDTGITLNVTPQITSASTIKLRIEAEESEADFSRTVDGIPAVVDNKASTTVLVRNGETTVIGGMMKVRKSNAKNGVPFVSTIPIVGWLFKNKTKQKSDNELLIFITPRIVYERSAIDIPPSNYPPESVQINTKSKKKESEGSSSDVHHKYQR